MSPVVSSPAWRALEAHAKNFKSDISSLFADDPQRAQDFSVEAAGFYLDYSRQRASRETRTLLLKLAQQQELRRWIDRLFAGEAVNSTEHRAALHMALRAPRDAVIRAAGEDVVPAVHAVLQRMAAFAGKLRSGAWRGYSDRKITDVVNLGIGGSDLGPRMVCDALRDLADGPRLHFVANIDGAQLDSALKTLNPATTLFIVTSKTFTTQETMANARSARAWFLQSAEEADIPLHFVAVSTNQAEVRSFGISAENMFEFWDWVGGRYSLWSAVGLSIVLALGEQRFAELHAGAHAMDGHFRSAPFESNLPVLLALLNVWNTNFLGCASQVIAPYTQRLDQFVCWLQQLEMESNGKSVSRDGSPVGCATTPVLWGGVGTNSQHAFFQMLHQGPATHPVEFILPLAADHALKEQHRMLIANCLAQGAALMRGKTAEQVRAELSARGLAGAELEAAIPHRVFSGNRPSNTLLLPRLDAYNLGALLALYEHRTFAQSVVWNINPFDQWGVELGKQLAGDVLRAMAGESVELDPPSRRLLSRLPGRG